MTERRRKKTKLFTADVRSLLYAFGDVQDPLNDTVDALEDILVNFIVDTCHDATHFAKVTKRQKIKVDDFAFSWRRDPVKYGRVFDLLRLQDDIKEARRQYNNPEDKSSYKDMDDDDAADLNDDYNGNADNMNSNGITGTGSGKATTQSKKEKKPQEPERKKRKYTKSGKERKPYKKRAKKSDLLQPPTT